MKLSLALLRTLSLVALFSVSLTLPALGVTRVKSGSGYGDFTGTTASDVENCFNGSNPTCEAFNLLTNPGTLDGATVLNAYEFADSNNGGEEVEIFDLGSISNPLTLTGDPSLQIFACGANFAKGGAVSNVAFDNHGDPLSVPLPCTPVSDSSSDYAPCFMAPSETCTADAGNKQFAVTFDQNGITFNSTNGDDVVVVSDMGPVATVEPGTLSLLAIGLIGLIGILVHRTS
jgi:hypothetical protein